MMSYLVRTSQRTTGVQVPHAFVREGEPPPLTRLIRGGRGGEARTKLYLTACMIAAASPYSYSKETPASSWAEVLGLPDPSLRGARRISDAFAWLDKNKYLKVDRRQGRPPTFSLLDQHLTGGPYTKPTTKYTTVPIALWSNHWIAALSAADLAVLLAILDAPGEDEPGVLGPRYLTGSQKAHTHLSADSWTKATQRLSALGLLTVDRQVEGGPMMYRRNRNVYQLEDMASFEPRWAST